MQFRHIARYWAQYLLGFLLLLLVFFIGWTYYLGTPSVTFERLIGSRPYNTIKALSLRRYKEGAISPHLFRFQTENEAAVIERLSHDCDLHKILPRDLSKVLEQVDKEMVAVIKDSPYVYQSKHYRLKDPKQGRLCVLFRDKKKLYLFVNGNL